jgi:hypothetical protein
MAGRSGDVHRANLRDRGITLHGSNWNSYSSADTHLLQIPLRVMRARLGSVPTEMERMSAAKGRFLAVA